MSAKLAQTLMKELKPLLMSPPEGIKCSIDDDCFTNLNAEIAGPEGTPFEGGSFKVRLTFGQDYPQAPPKGIFLTKIFHPNISNNGEICVNTLKRDWEATLGIRHVLLVIRCLLINPNPESALNEEAGQWRSNLSPLSSL